MPERKKKPEMPPAEAPAQTRRQSVIVRRFTQGTLLALSLGTTPAGGDPANPDWKVFDQSVVDRLEAPLTRYHE